MIYKDNRAAKCAPHVLFLTSDPVICEQIKEIIVRMGGAVKAILSLSFISVIRMFIPWDLSGEAY